MMQEGTAGARGRGREVCPSWADRVVEAGTLFVLVFTPLAFGTVEPWSEAIAELAVLGMVTVWVLGMLRQWELRLELPPGWLPASLFLAAVLLQATPLPVAVVTWVAPLSRRLAGEAFAYTGATPGLVPISLAPHATWREAIKLVAVAAFLLLTYNTYRTRRQVHRAVWTMIVVGGLIALFGIIQRVTWTGRFYWIGPEAPHSSGFGPFVNRAHFAGLMVIVVPVALALLLRGRPESGRAPLVRSWADRLRQWNSRGPSPAGLLLVMILLMGAAALVSGSRGGAVALLAALLAMIALGARGRSGTGRVARVAVTTVLILLGAVWIGGDILSGTLERLAEEITHSEDSPRLRLWTDALKLWWAAPLFGSGLASFGVVFPRVRSFERPDVFTHAESDWVELLTDTGALGLGLALATLASVLWALRRRHRWASSPSARALALAGLVALIGSAAQGIANFNLPVMSNWFYLATVSAVALRGGEEST